MKKKNNKIILILILYDKPQKLIPFLPKSELQAFTEFLLFCLKRYPPPVPVNICIVAVYSYI
jgi:hypothetical protein